MWSGTAALRFGTVVVQSATDAFQFDDAAQLSRTGGMQFATGLLQSGAGTIQFGPARQPSKSGRTLSMIARQQPFVATGEQESASAAKRKP